MEANCSSTPPNWFREEKKTDGELKKANELMNLVTSSGDADSDSFEKDDKTGLGPVFHSKLTRSTNAQVFYQGKQACHAKVETSNVYLNEVCP